MRLFLDVREHRAQARRAPDQVGDGAADPEQETPALALLGGMQREPFRLLPGEKLLLGLLHFQPARGLLFGEPLLLLAAELRKALRLRQGFGGQVALFILLLLALAFVKRLRPLPHESPSPDRRSGVAPAKGPPAWL